ncbi:MAG: corrinoid protein [Sporomusaceae bacterium]|nr:corrinoid protein [Sporomusaceae bacterium]
MSALLEQIAGNLVEGQSKKVRELVQQALDEGVAAKEILNNGLLAGMNEVGALFKDGELFVPEVLVAAKAMNAGMEVLAPLLAEGDIEKKGKAVFATVKGDLHDIGIKLVGMMMEGAGYEIVNIGVDIPPEQIVAAVREHKPDLVGMAAMLTTTMVAMKDTVEALKEAGLYDKVKVMVGGSPVTDRFAREIGAYYAADASASVEVANKLMEV